MKRTVFTLAIAFTLLSVFAFTWNSTDLAFDELLDNQTKSEMLFTTDEDALKEKLGDFLSAHMEKVHRVDAHYGLEKEYYYAVYGEKAGEAVVQQILVSEEMVCQQEFPTLEQMGLDTESRIVNCYWVTTETDAGISFISCEVANQGVICGVSPSGGLCVRIRIFPFGEI